MAKNRVQARATDEKPPEAEADDTQGNVFLPDPMASREIARGREREIEKAVRERQRNKGARGR